MEITFIYLYFIAGFISTLYLLSDLILDMWDSEDYFVLMIPILASLVFSIFAPLTVLLAKIKLIKRLINHDEIFRK